MSRRSIITEREIHRAKREGKTSIDVSGAVVTPSGLDAAKVAGIELMGGRRAASFRAGAPHESRPHESRPPRATGRQNTSSGVIHKKASDQDHAPRRVPPRGKDARADAGRRTPDAGGAPPSDKRSPAAQPDPSHQSAAHASESAPKSSPLTIAIGADHGGVALKDAIGARLRELGHTVNDLGTTGTDPVDYPDFAIAVARAVASGGATLGIMVDGAGIGSSMAANKVAGARAALCYDITTATNAREHNNANVLTLGGGLIGKALALAIVETFITVPFAGGRHAKRVQKIDALDEARGPR